ncbi:hypothetical protein Bca52824_094139 [Brassica carinata]|uniref:Uncharacterized protein n=1 Tax=Brassica carinata TaxID=52824 RepID=A0A8X7TJI1_BRACI|nr:hypothetical protein Bca52824_094139 [Brassica carinata]
MGVNYAEESTFTRESKSLDFIDYDGREDLEPKYNKSYLDLVKERRSKIRALLWKQRLLDPIGTSKAKEPEKKVSHDEKNENSKKKSFKQASWYREPNVELTKAASDPGKVPNRGSLSKQVPKLVTQGKENSSVCSQVMVNPADVDVDEVISPLKDLLKAKKPSERCEERGGRRGNPIKSRLGTRADAALHARKKIARSPYRDYNSRKRQAVSHDNAPKKRLFEDENQEKRDRGSIPLPPTVG